MIEDARKVDCGGCGQDTFAIYQLPDGLAIKCLKCKSVTVLVPSRPGIEVDWDRSEGDGTLVNKHVKVTH